MYFLILLIVNIVFDFSFVTLTQKLILSSFIAFFFLSFLLHFNFRRIIALLLFAYKKIYIKRFLFSFFFFFLLFLVSVFMYFLYIYITCCPILTQSCKYKNGNLVAFSFFTSVIITMTYLSTIY